jgi:hypothetical protein
VHVAHYRRILRPVVTKEYLFKQIFLAVCQQLETPGWFYKQKVSYTHFAVSSPDDPFFGSTAGRKADVTVSNFKRTFKLTESGRLTDVSGYEAIGRSPHQKEKSSQGRKKRRRSALGVKNQ